jgi:hypothetical protein
MVLLSMTRRPVWLCASLVSLATGAWAQAPNAWGASVTSGELTSVDLTTGTATAVGPLGNEITAMAHDPNSDTLYGIQRSPGALVTIDRTSGATTMVGLLGTEKVAAGAAYDPTTDTLYMADFVNANDLWTVDTSTGAATSIGTHGLSTLQGLAFDPGSNTLYASSGNGSTSALYTLDTTSAAPTLVGFFNIQVFDHGLARDGTSGKLYLAEANAGTNMLYEVNPTTAVLTPVGPLGDSLQALEIEGQPLGTGTPVCFGDGSGAPCGCGNEVAGTAGGCQNGLGATGVLTASGTASVTADTMSLTCTGVRAQPGLFFQGDNTIGGGSGSTFGDGIRCCGQNVVRIQVVVPSAPEPATAQMTETATTNGPAGTVQPGDKKCYQYWYRDPALSPCGSNFNLSNAVSITWQP